MAAFAPAQVLFDGREGALPEAGGWGWTYAGTGGSVIGPNATGVVSVNSGPQNTPQQGWGQSVSLDPVGAVLRWDGRILSETSANADRAGFSLLWLNAEARGIELAFGTGTIFAQSDDPLFTRAEEAAVDNTAFGTGVAGLRRYELALRPDRYELRVDGVLALSGLLRDYSAFQGFPNPYATPGAVFFGDNTTSAQAEYEFSYVELSPIPEPASLIALGLGLAALRLRRRATG